MIHTYADLYPSSVSAVCYLSEECVLMMSDGNVLVLGSVRDDLN